MNREICTICVLKIQLTILWSIKQNNLSINNNDYFNYYVYDLIL